MPRKNPPKVVQRYLRSHGNRANNEVIGIIVHYISAINVQPKDPYDVERIIKIFNDYGVSADYMIDREGTVYRLVPKDRYSYHAGISIMPTGEGTPTSSGKTTVNKITMGIELVGTYSSGYTEAQYESLEWLSKEIMKVHPKIDKAHIVGHEHVSPGRKKDPGPKFDWDRYYQSLGL